MTAKQYPCARIVMPAAEGLEYIGRLRGMVDELIKRGVIQPIPPAATGPGVSGKTN